MESRVNYSLTRTASLGLAALGLTLASGLSEAAEWKYSLGVQNMVVRDVNSHTFGLVCIKVGKEGDGLKASEAWVNKEMKINISTPVLLGHFLYSQGPGKNLVCVDAVTGKVMWSQEGFGEKYSSVIAVGTVLLVVTDRGELVMVAADSSKYKELGRAQICGKTWNHPAYAEGKLYVREGLTSGWKLSCVEMGGR